MTKKIFRRKIRTAWRLWNHEGWRALVRTATWRFSYPYLRARIRHLRAEQPREFPRYIQVEVSSNCNLRCPSCSLSREVNPGRHLTPNELRVILGRFRATPGAISLNGIGEPLINPHFLELVDILAEHGVNCTFFTNGTLLTPRIQEAILSRANVSYVGISCDGARQETFEALRVGAKFETWKKFVRGFLAGAHGRDPRPIQTVMSTVVSRRNLPELGEIISLAAELGFPAVQFADIVPNDPVAASMAITDAEWEALDRGGLIEKGAACGVQVSFSFRRERVPPRGALRCFQPWEYIMVSAEGDVLPCCAIVGSDKADVMGNLLKQDFAEIWNGERFHAFRKTSADGTNRLCQMCPYY